MNGSVIATLAVGIPVALIALATFLLSRSKDQQESTRRTVGDMIAPALVRITSLETRVDELEHKGKRRD